MKNTLYNAVVFNLAWLVCVFGGNTIAVPTALVVIGVHCYLISDNSKEIFLITIIIAVGVLVDSALIRTGFLVSPDQSLWPPLWLVSLWGLFATTLNHSLKWFQNHTAIAVVLGGISGSLTYFAGTRLSDFSLKQPQAVTLAVMFLVWCCVFPLCLRIANTLLNKRSESYSQ